MAVLPEPTAKQLSQFIAIQEYAVLIRDAATYDAIALAHPELAEIIKIMFQHAAKSAGAAVS